MDSSWNFFQTQYQERLALVVSAAQHQRTNRFAYENQAGIRWRTQPSPESSEAIHQGCA